MPKNKQLEPYGLWPSPITPELTGTLLEFSEPVWNGKGFLLWMERESHQAGIRKFCSDEKKISELTANINVGGGIGYGGGSFTAQGDRVVFVEKGSNQLYLHSLGDKKAKKMTSSLLNTASPRISLSGKYLVFVHSDGASDTISILEITNPKSTRPLISGSDFYSYPRWHPDGTRLAWISWNHPHMPWDSSRLSLGQLSHRSGGLLEIQDEIIIAGGDGISVLQPEFSPNGHFLAYISDQTGWWQIHIYNLESGEHRQLTHSEAEHALPPWLQEQRTYGFSGDNKQIYFLRNQTGFVSLWLVDLVSGEESQIRLEGDFTWLEGLVISKRKDLIALTASRGDTPQCLITVTPDGQTSVIRSSTANHLPQDEFSLPQPISWQSEEGISIHGLFYPPHNPVYRDEGLPPLLVIIHSGPARQKGAEFQPRVQYFTSRGYAVLEVNYRGSTGYGRTYREHLKGEWGVLDVADCLSGARFVTDQGWANRDNMVLFGSSSGGLTVLQSLIAHPGVFCAGITLYGITNHIALLENPPKFERYYSNWLLGPYPEATEVLRARSPLYSADRIRDPVAVFQGGKDPIVPLDQAEQLIAVLQKNGVPHEYHLYPEEGHGFKRFENVRDFYHKTDAFLRKYVIKT